MNFKGKWITRCGLIAIVMTEFGTIGWMGIVEIPPDHKIPTNWDLNGKSNDERYDLMQRFLGGEGL